MSSIIHDIPCFSARTIHNFPLNRYFDDRAVNVVAPFLAETGEVQIKPPILLHSRQDLQYTYKCGQVNTIYNDLQYSHIFRSHSINLYYLVNVITETEKERKKKNKQRGREKLRIHLVNADTKSIIKRS